MEKNKSLVFVDFSGVSVEDMNNLRRNLKQLGSQLKVIKKKLLRIILQNKKIDFDPEQFEVQLGTIFSEKDIKDISEIANPLYKFFKKTEKKGFKILGGYDLMAKNFLDGETIIKIGQLPTREVLLSRLVGVLSGPIKMFLYVLDQKSKQTVEIINQRPTTNNQQLS